MGRKKKREKMKPREERGPNLSALPSPSLLSLTLFTLRCSPLYERLLWQANIDITDDQKGRASTEFLRTETTELFRFYSKLFENLRRCRGRSRIFFKEAVASMRVQVPKVINNSWRYKPTRAPHSGQVDDFETQWNTSWKSLVFHHVFTPSDILFLICIFIDYSNTA